MTSARAAVLVASDADLPLAAARCAWGACADAARGGSAVRRIYVEKGAREEFRKLLLQNVQDLKTGPGADVGPLTDEAAAAAVEPRGAALEKLAAAARGGARAVLFTNDLALVLSAFERLSVAALIVNDVTSADREGVRPALQARAQDRTLAVRP